jgi:hypothetical protein
MTVAHRRAKSPIPGLVVILLATAAVIFGVAVVRRPGAGDTLASELAALRGMVDELQTAQEKLRRNGDRTRTGLSSLEEELSSSVVTLASLEERLARGASALDSAHIAAPVHGSDATDALLELTAELRAIQVRLNELEQGLDSIPALSRAVPALEVLPAQPADRFAGGTGEAIALDVAAAHVDQPAPADRAQPADRTTSAEWATGIDPAAATDEPAMPADAVDETDVADETVASASTEPNTDAPLGEVALAAARAAAEQHAELLAPFFGAGCEQPDGSRTRDPGPMSLEALHASGALAPVTSDVPEQNEGLRLLAEVASNAPNDRPHWPYGRGSRARVWYLRRDGRADVPLAHSLLLEHGRAFVELGLLTR